MSVDTAILPQCVRATDGARPPRSLVLNSPASGMLWFGGWLFTLAFADVGFWKGVLALLLWPYYLGVLAR